ncbi:hypothetical protein B0A55_06523 [Friedmanniomyces simplex]|uniref:Methyltransferase type 11 domain-containing protein n=1 Tax=Friedmanniomyces simplex TaxID=329884 RepID=A0A4U0X7Z2_9PEZI|nr:hypothetical protein B0A55_06523 [Friedmanniomyces simplex]
MSSEGYSSDLEVVSKNMASSELNDSVDSKFTSPEDSPHQSIAPFDMDAGKKFSDVKLDTSMINGDSRSSIDAVLNGNGHHGSTISPEDASNDPMLASALMSPLQAPLNIEAMFTPAPGGKPPLQRAPTILQRTHSDANDWELYKRAGPRYPASLEQLIMKYHQKNSNSWQLAHDMGAGSGVYATNLARFFRHIHVSDPTATGIATSRKTLSAWSAENPKKRGRFTFSVCKPEEATEAFTDNSVDLTVLMDSAHFTDAEATVRSAAQTLTPGGTLAIITHRPISHVVGNEKVAVAVQALFDAWGPRPWEIACGADTKSQQQFSLGLDFVPLPDDLFSREKSRRITINARSAPREYFRVPGVQGEEEEDSDGAAAMPMSPDEMLEMATSRVGDREKRVHYGEEDEQGRGWRYEVGWESFRTRVAVLDTPETVARLEPRLKEIERLIMKTSPNGVTVVIECAVAVVLATKK